MAKPETLRRILKENNISADIIEKINGNFEDVTDKSTKMKKSEYLIHAVDVMDTELDYDIRRKVMESCACTIGSSLEKKTERFAKETRELTLEEKLRKLYKIKHLGTPVLQKDGTILIGTVVGDDGIYRCPCPQISGIEIKKNMSFTYCMCCGGHYKYQYEKALGVKLDVKQISSPLESGGKMPCAFILKIL